MIATVASEVLGETEFYAASHFSATHTVFVNVFQYNLFVNDVGYFKIQVEVKVLCPCTTPQVFVSKFKHFAVNLNGFCSMALLTIRIGGTVLYALSTHITKLVFIVQRCGAEGGIGN